MGFSCKIYRQSGRQAGPFLIAERIEGDDLPTVLSYGHGDVIRAQTDQWREGLHPFQLVEEGDRLYGRGTADNKGQHLINIAALDAVLQTAARSASTADRHRNRRGNRLAGPCRVLSAHKERLRPMC